MDSFSYTWLWFFKRIKPNLVPFYGQITPKTDIVSRVSENEWYFQLEAGSTEGNYEYRVEKKHCIDLEKDYQQLKREDKLKRITNG